MTWLAWRQFRPQALAGLGVVVALAVWMILLGTRVRTFYDDRIADCTEASCETARRDFVETFSTWLSITDATVLSAPALIGLFWGAPLVARELENGTHRLAWTQGVSRTRWLAVKLVVVAAAAAVVGAVLATLLGWAADPYDSLVGSRFGAMTFGARGIVPMGYAVFAFVLGTTVGLLLRRTLPAMALTLLVVVLVQLAMPLLVREHLIDPVQRSIAVEDATASRQIDSLGIADDDPGSPVEVSGYTVPGAWMLAERSTLRSADGRAITAADFDTCRTGSMMEDLECLDATGGVHFDISYHPAGRFWPFQGIETGLMLCLGAVLAGLAFWRLPHAAG